MARTGSSGGGAARVVAYGSMMRRKRELAPRGDVTAMVGRIFADARPSGVISVYIYGSWAEGRTHRESDVDVAVLLCYGSWRTRQQRFAERVRLCAWLGAELRTDRVDLVVLNDAPPHLARRIVTTGQRVFCADAPADHAFVRDVQLRAADLEPFLRRTRRLKLAAIAR